MILYHYCSTEIFYSIVLNKQIWLSSLSLSNDTMEGKWLCEIARLVCIDKGYYSSLIDKIVGHISILNQTCDGLGLCLSESGDMLSQWRGYAQDGAGICVGFSCEYFENLARKIRENGLPSFAIHKIQYDEAKQKDLISPQIDKIKACLDEGALDFPSRSTLLTTPTNEDERNRRQEAWKLAFNRLSMTVLPLIANLFELKNPAFSEEKEWRIVGLQVGKDFEGCSYRASGGRLIPYRVVPLEDNGIQPIVDVILGPRHLTSAEVVKAFLVSCGFSGVNICTSKSSYRSI